MALLKAIGTLFFVVLMVSIVIQKIGDTFPGITYVGWIIMALGFAAVVGIAMGMEPLLMRINWKWMNESEDRRMTIASIASLWFVVACVYVLWPWISSYLTPYFGS